MADQIEHDRMRVARPSALCRNDDPFLTEKALNSEQPQLVEDIRAAQKRAEQQSRWL
jgi:hypothetical protein